MIDILNIIDTIDPKLLNPNVKKGDKVIILQKNNNQMIINGSIHEVIKGSAGTGTPFTVANPSGTGVISIYRSGLSDVYMLANKEYQLLILNAIKQEIDEQIEFLEKYENEEEFIADKIDQLMKAEGVKAKAKILRTLKKSNYL